MWILQFEAKIRKANKLFYLQKGDSAMMNSCETEKFYNIICGVLELPYIMKIVSLIRLPNLDSIMSVEAFFPTPSYYLNFSQVKGN